MQVQVLSGVPSRKASAQPFKFQREVILETTVTVASLLTDAATVIPQGVAVAWDIITSNPLLIFFAGASLVSMGFGYWRKAKRAAR